MLQSINFRSDRRELADEIRTPINQINLITKFAASHPEKRYNFSAVGVDISIQDIEVQVRRFVKSTGATNTAIEFSSILDFQNFDAFPRYLNYPVTDFETFNQLIKLKASDIYIDGPLAFSAGAIGTIPEDTLPYIRVSPTVSPNASLYRPDITNFFLRPEDVDLYDETLKHHLIIDFKLPAKDKDKEDTLFDIYKRKYFGYDLFYLVPGITGNNILIPPDFARTRLNCGCRCKIGELSSTISQCHYCHTAQAMATSTAKYLDIEQKLKEKGLSEIEI